MNTIDIAAFIGEYVTGRSESFFSHDIYENDAKLSAEIGGKNVLVIGGGGTIGSNYIKSLLPYKPESVVVIDTNENGLTELVRDIRSTANLPVPKHFITYPVNLGDRIFEKIYEHYKPFDIVANFAAHKHVRSEKDVFSVEAMIQNNLFYAYRLLKLIQDDKPAHFFCVSTDKAANPVNVMGATKKLMEDLVMQFSNSLRCTTARFANVAFSNGSLLDGFLYRLRYRQPFSVPADVRRYFVSPEESGQICMLASVLGKTGDIFFPKLMEDELTSFLDITRSFIEQLGFTYAQCDTEAEAKDRAKHISSTGEYPVYVFNSDTTGEKLYEEFYTADELVDWDRFHALAVAKGKSPVHSLDEYQVVKELENLFSEPAVSKQQIVEVLSKHIPTFEHVEKGVGLDSKM